MSQSENLPTILAIDLGTSALKAVLYDRAGRVLAIAAERYGYRTPQPGWAEADPVGWWLALIGALSGLRDQVSGFGSIRAMGLTGQMHAPVLLDGAGQPLAPTILWLDRRAEVETAELIRSLDLPPYQLNSTFTLPKLLWLARHRPEVVAQAHALLWPKDYLRYRLTGHLATDVTEAAGAGLLDWQTRQWAVERLRSTGLRPSALPPLLAANADAGSLLPDIAAQLGLPASTRVIVGAGDVIALVGGAPLRPGRLSCSLGSSSMISCPLGPGQSVHDPGHRLHVYPFLPIPLLNGVQSTSGASLTWAWRALYGEETPLATVLEAALATPPGAEWLLFLPFLAGERSPYWNDTLRGSFYGLTLSHDRPYLLRAVLEGVAYSLRHLIDIAEELGVSVQELALAGGGATVAGWPQIIADVCRRPVLIYAGQETVTRPLYAYCLNALDRTVSFEAALASTFDLEPAHREPRQALGATYEPIYRRYRALADFVAAGPSASKEFL